MTKAVDIFSDFAVNETVANEGTWVPYRDDIEFLIARAGNRKFKKLAQVQFKKHGRLLEAGGEAGEAKGKEIMIELFAKSILLGWKGSVVFQGAELTYSEENAKKLLALDGFRDWVDTQAKDEAAYKAVKDEEEEKN